MSTLWFPGRRDSSDTSLAMGRRQLGIEDILAIPREQCLDNVMHRILLCVDDVKYLFR